ncbi:hypothetical protein JMUB7513_28000 [Staphylococcus aureus]
MQRSLVGSEMCIRDSSLAREMNNLVIVNMPEGEDCLLYTSDAADEEDSVDLGGRRIIKKKFF